MGKIKIGSIIQYVIFLGLGLGLIWYSSKDLTAEQMAQLKASFSQTRFLYMLPVVVVLMFAHLSRTIRWKLLMRTLGYEPRLSNTFLAVMIGYFFNLLMPRLGEVMKCTILAKYEHVAPEKLVGTIVAERAVDLVCLLLVIVIMVVIQFDVMGAYTIDLFKKLVQQKGGGINWLLITVLIIAVVLLVYLLKFILSRFGKKGPLLRIKNIIHSIWQGLSSISRVEKPGIFLFHTVAIWTLYFASIWLGFQAFPAVAHLGAKAAVSILVFGSLGMIATQGGIGAYQLAVEKTLLMYGISPVAGLAFGWVLWGAQTIITLVAGLICIVILPLINRKKHA